MRLAAVTDIHGNLPALDAVIDAIRRERVDLVVDLGDIAAGPLWPRQTCERLRGLGWPTIAGNHERQTLAAVPGAPGDDAFAAAELGADDREWLASLPATRLLDGGDVWLVHGTPSDDLEPLLETVTPDHEPGAAPGVRPATADEVAARLGPTAATLVLCGHTHMPRTLQLGRTLVVNPGSLGRPAYDDVHPWPYRSECGSPHARWALFERGPAGWSVQLRATAYDWESAAARAESLGAHDWAWQLRTGRVGPSEAAALGRGPAARTPA